MKKIAIWAVKGGVGKSTVTARLGLTLKSQGKKVGFFDADITGSTLATALGIAKPYPKVGLDTANQKILPVRMDGYEIFDLLFVYGEAALLWNGGERRVRIGDTEVDMKGTGRASLVRQMLRDVEFSPELDYLLLDLPPGSGDETITLFENIQGLYGAILVCQPTTLSIQDIERNLDIARFKKIPLLGMIGNMTFTICPECGHHYVPFLDAGVDLPAYCREHGVPYLGSVPFLPFAAQIDRVFEDIAETVDVARPVRIWERSMRQRVEDGLMGAAVRRILG